MEPLSTFSHSFQTDSLEFYHGLATEALKKYAVSDQATIRLLNYSENYTYLVEDSDPSFRSILRISCPGYHTKQELESEIVYLKSIMERSIIEVPEPIAGLNGLYIQELVNDPFESPYYCTMFSFLTGEAPSEDCEEDLIQQFEKLGEITAILHNHSQLWEGSQSLDRPTWNYETTLGSKPNWGRWQDGVAVTPERKLLFQNVSETIHTRLSQFGTSSDRFGLIHADLRTANLLIDDHRIKVLDFDDCGYGWYLYDLGAALSFIEHKEYVPDLIQAWLTGYKKIRSLSIEEEEEIPTFIMLRRLLLVGWVGSHYDTELAKSLGAKFTEQTVELAEKYLELFG